MNTLETIRLTKKDLSNFDYIYQQELTKKLDCFDSDFTQEIINEIILWKVNRYALISSETLTLLNKIKKSETLIDVEITKEILTALLSTKGIRLAMASTILRFKNPKIYQIIDQRVYRFLTGHELRYSQTDLSTQIELYLKYLKILKQSCLTYQIKFEDSDRIIYELDKKYNKDLKIKY